MNATVTRNDCYKDYFKTKQNVIAKPLFCNCLRHSCPRLQSVSYFAHFRIAFPLKLAVSNNHIDKHESDYATVTLTKTTPFVNSSFWLLASVENNIEPCTGYR